MIGCRERQLNSFNRMWKERADYGHFFYRIPNGESAADAYDRVSGFNETLWRSFEEPDFGSVCVLVTHGLMTRVFLMRWYVPPPYIQATHPYPQPPTPRYQGTTGALSTSRTSATSTTANLSS